MLELLIHWSRSVGCLDLKNLEIALRDTLPMMSAASITVSTINPVTTSRIPLGRSQADWGFP